MVKTIEPPPHRPLISELLFPPELHGKPDFNMLLDHLSKEGRVSKSDCMRLV